MGGAILLLLLRRGGIPFVPPPITVLDESDAEIWRKRPAQDDAFRWRAAEESNFRQKPAQDDGFRWRPGELRKC